MDLFHQKTHFAVQATAVCFPGKQNQNQHGQPKKNDKQNFIVHSVYQPGDHGNHDQKFCNQCHTERPLALAGELPFQAGPLSVTLPFPAKKGHFSQLLFFIATDKNSGTEKENATDSKKQKTCLHTLYYSTPFGNNAVSGIAVPERLKPSEKSKSSDKNQKFIWHLFGFFQTQLLFLCFRSGSCLKLHLPGFFYFICLGLICGCPFAAFCCFSRFFRFAAGKSSHFRVPGIFSEFPYQIQGCGYAQNADCRHSDADTPFDVAPHSPFEFTGPFPQKLSAQNQYHRKIGKHPQQDAFFSFRQFFQFCIQFPTPPLNILDFSA